MSKIKKIQVNSRGLKELVNSSIELVVMLFGLLLMCTLGLTILMAFHMAFEGVFGVRLW